MTASTLQLPHTGRLWPVTAALGGGLVLFAYGPLYMPPVWAAALFLGRGSDAARHSVLALLVIAASLGAVPLLLEGDVVAAAAALLLQAAGGVAVHYALDFAEARRGRGLLLAAGAWLLLPSAPGLLGLALLALYLGHTRQLGDRQRAHVGYHLRRGALLAALGLGLAAAVPTLLLNPAQTPRLVVDPVGARERQARADLPLAAPPPAQQEPYVVRPFRYPFSREQWRLDRDPRQVPQLLDHRYRGLRDWATRAAPYGIALTVALLALVVLRLRASGRSLRVRRQLHWSEPLVVVALVLLVASLLAVGLVLGMDNSSGPVGGGGGASLGGAEVDTSRDGPRAPTPVTDTGMQALTAALLPLGLAGIALALALLALALVRFGRTAEPELPPESAPAAPLPAGPPPATRVRRAYAAVLRAASGVGLGRRRTETPAEWAERLIAEHPGLAGDLRALTAAYQGVRYGQTPDERAAGDAESAAGRLQDGLGALSPAAPGASPRSGVSPV